MTQENGRDNLYTRIYRLLVTERYAEAEQMLDNTWHVIRPQEKQFSPGRN